MNIPIKYHCGFPGCIASAAVELDRSLGLPSEGWTYRLLDDLPDNYYCPEHAGAVEPERQSGRQTALMGRRLAKTTGLVGAG
jgi:hypothetical protein